VQHGICGKNFTSIGEQLTNIRISDFLDFLDFLFLLISSFFIEFVLIFASDHYVFTAQIHILVGRREILGKSVKSH